MRARRETAWASARVRPRRSLLPAAVEGVLAVPGEPLAVAVRAEMERRFGHDFGDVRVHADTQAAAAARLLGADAFTSGTDIVFGEDRYRPHAEDGRRLIAHELVHTLQQGRGAATSLQISAPDTDPLEHEAAAVAARIIAGETLQPGAVSIAAPAARGRIARQARAALERLPAEVPDSPEAVRALADDIARLLAFDPADDAGRVKRRLARFAPATREAIATELAGRIPATTAAQLRRILTDLLPTGTRPVAAEAGIAPAEGEPAEAAVPETVPAGDEPAAILAPPEPAAETLAPDAIPEPLAVPDGPVAEPEVEGDPAPPEPEAAETPAVEPAQEQRRQESAAGVPATEAAEPGEDAADTAPADDTETEVLEAHDEADAEAAEAAPAEEAIAPEASAEAAPAVGGGSLADLAEEPNGGGDEPVAAAQVAAPEESRDDADADEESVVEPPAGQLTAEHDAAVAGEPADENEEAPSEPAGAELAGAEDADAEDEPESPADAALGEEGADVEGAEQPGAGAGSELDAAAAGGGAPIEEPAERQTVDLSEADPAEAMEAAGDLPPGESEAALGSVDAAASRSVAAQRTALAEQPPELDRPTGAPTAAELAAEATTAVSQAAPARLQRAPEPPPAAATRIQPLPAPPPPVAARAPAPQIPGDSQGALNDDGRRALQASLKALPVHDPALDVSPGPAPAVALEGGADPQRAHAERDKLETAARGALADGRREIVKPAGEQHLLPDVPAERLTATVPAVPRVAAAPPPAAQATLATDPSSLLAREKRGAELRTAAKDAAAGMRTRKADQAATAQEERRRSQEQVTQAVRDSAARQATARADARGEVHAERTRWSTAEHELAEGDLTKADTTVGDAVGKVTTLKTDADKKAATHIETGERDADTARREGEKQAAAERKRGEEKTSSGVLGWLADQATAFFDEIKAGITKAFEVARAAVRTAIESAKKLAAAAIDLARDAIVSAIRLAGDALIAIGDHLLAGFPAVRDRFRRAINDRVEQAQRSVNALADGLKDAVQKALDLLGAALDAALGLLEKGLLAMVEAYRAAVAGALKWAQSVVNAFLAFAALVKDVAANPKQWLANLAASAKDGVRNHLWKAFKAAIKQWFSDKVEEVLGLGLTVWNLLKKGGLSLSRIGSMAWQAIKTAIPPTLIQIIVEKLISLLIPAAAAVMMIIETLQAAWGTIQRVLEAFERFFAFLKAVRTGKAGPQFARAIAAAAIAVIDFVANWLLKRLRKPAGKIAKKLKALAKKLGKKLAKFGKGIKKKLFGGKRKKPKKLKGKPKKKPKPDKHAKAERRVKAATDFLAAQFAKARPQLILWAQIQYARVRWRVRIGLRAKGEDGTLTVQANPIKKLQLTEDYKKGDILDYNKRALEYQGFLRKDHQRHHIYTRTHRAWWDAAGIDWNAPEHMLEIPDALHLGVLHGSFKRLDAHLGRKSAKERYKNLRDAWNVVWGEWIVPRMSAVMSRFRLPPFAMFLETASAARRKLVREMMRVKANSIVDLFAGLTGIPLWRFQLTHRDDTPLVKFRKSLAKFEADLKKKGISGVKKIWRIRRWKTKHALPVIPPLAILNAIKQWKAKK